MIVAASTAMTGAATAGVGVAAAAELLLCSVTVLRLCFDGFCTRGSEPNSDVAAGSSPNSDNAAVLVTAVLDEGIGVSLIVIVVADCESSDRCGSFVLSSSESSDA